jgi:hypothetical protein
VPLLGSCKAFVEGALLDTVDYSALGQNVAVKTIECGHCQRTASAANFTCQHGPEECAGNAAIMCGLYVTKDCDQVADAAIEQDPPFHVLPPWAIFVHCMYEAQGSMSTTDSLNKCLVTGYAGCPLAQAELVAKCMHGPDGEQLMMTAYQESVAANVTGTGTSKPHSVPLIVVDGVPLADPSQLKRAVCDVIANDPARKLVNPGACD